MSRKHFHIFQITVTSSVEELQSMVSCYFHKGSGEAHPKTLIYLHNYNATAIWDNTHGRKAADDKIHKLQVKLNSRHILTVCRSVNRWSHLFCNTWYLTDFHNSSVTSTGTIITHWKEKMYTISKSLLLKIQKYCI